MKFNLFRLGNEAINVIPRVVGGKLIFNQYLRVVVGKLLTRRVMGVGGMGEVPHQPRHVLKLRLRPFQQRRPKERP